MSDNTSTEELRERYEVFWQIDFMISAFGPDDVTLEVLQAFANVFTTAALRAARSGTLPAVPDDLSGLTERGTPPSWEDTWSRLKQDIRNERIRLGRELGRELGLEPPDDTPNAP